MCEKGSRKSYRMDDQTLNSHSGFIAVWPKMLRKVCQMMVEPVFDTIIKSAKGADRKEAEKCYEILEQVRENYGCIYQGWAEIVYNEDDQLQTYPVTMDITNIDRLITYLQENAKVFQQALHRVGLCNSSKYGGKDSTIPTIIMFCESWSKTGNSIMGTCKKYFKQVPANETKHSQRKVQQSQKHGHFENYETVYRDAHQDSYDPKHCEIHNHIDQTRYADNEGGTGTAKVTMERVKWVDQSKESSPLPKYKEGKKKYRRAEKTDSSTLLREKEDEIYELEEEKGMLLERVAELLGEKVKIDDRDVYAMSIEHQPRQVSEDYKALFSSKAFKEAKRVLKQQQLPGDDDDKATYAIFNNILKKNYELLTDVFQCQQRCILVCASDPFELWHKQHFRSTQYNSLHEEEDAKQLPNDFQIAISRFNRQHTASANLEKVAQDTLRKCLPPEVSSSIEEKVFPFCLKAASVIWRMVNQLPPMTFVWPEAYNKNALIISNQTEAFPENVAEICISHYIYPCLYHAERIMVEGRVFVVLSLDNDNQ